MSIERISVRVVNRFMSNGVTTLQPLLDATRQSLLRLKGFVKNRLEEAENFCAKINDIKADNFSKTKKGITEIAVSRPYFESVYLGDFSFADKLDPSGKENKILFQFKEAFDALGVELSFDYAAYPEKVPPIIDTLNAFENKTRRYFEIKKLEGSLSKEFGNNRSLTYVNAFTLSDFERIASQDLCGSENTTIMETAVTANLEKGEKSLLFTRFLKRRNFNLHAEIGDSFEKLYKNERNRLVIQGRAKKRTLERIVSELGVTRERIRQIEAKTKRAFSHYCSRIRIISKTSAERNGGKVLTQLEIEEYRGQNVQELLFPLNAYKSTTYAYDSKLHIFVLDDDSIQYRVARYYVETLYDIVRADKLSEILKIASDEEDIPAETLEKAFLNYYSLTDNSYRRYRLSLASVYEKILEKHHPEEPKTHDVSEIEKFINMITLEYGNVGPSQNDRALAARISSICVFRGRRILQTQTKEVYAPKEPTNLIYKYIIDGDGPIFLTDALFSIFEDELVEVGINDGRYLIGGKI